MPQITILTGTALILLGAISYFVTGMVSLTAFIPSFFGLALATLGALARKPEKLKLMMHVAAVIGVAGVAGAYPGIPAVIAMLGGATVERPGAAIARTIMFVICLAFVGACVNSFIQARRARKSIA